LPAKHHIRWENQPFTKHQPAAPDFSPLKALQAKMMARATKH
jgi:hypothetical protein